MIEIEKNIPLIPKFKSGGRAALYPFANMAVGDSFAIPVGDKFHLSGQPRSANSICVAAQRYAKINAPGVKFTTRWLKSEGIVRCWRVV